MYDMCTMCNLSVRRLRFETPYDLYPLAFAQENDVQHAR